MTLHALLAALLVPPLLAAGAAARGADTGKVTIYHCTDAKGRLTLSDAPCPKGQRQEARSMLRPQDPPARPAVPAQPVAPAPADRAPTRVVVLQPPRPLYECVTPDGERYTSDTNDGRPRYVPLWTLGYPVALGSATRPRPPGGARIDIDTGDVRVSAATRPRRHLLPHGHGYGYGYGAATTLVRDDCHALPQAEVCARLVDRRDAIRTRFFNAQQSERDELRIEERGINHRLANDCGVG
ncbi:DUF4124 domain-containing protein [Luteimonas vadosa]|uniref:DUF4124 domain-containing protein n=1 Tax=Luteimonas vadosa TaxID=1165507 RepID=A0ABP9DQM9_9GAMM